jgi:hypothetical protein
MRVLQALKQCQPGLESRGSDFAAELESAGASSRTDEIDLRGRFIRCLLPFRSLSASVGSPE